MPIAQTRVISVAEQVTSFVLAGGKGAVQLVKFRERAGHVADIPCVAATVPARALVVAGIGDDTLFAYGIPLEWLDECAPSQRG
jgi:hypothetical protein